MEAVRAQILSGKNKYEDHRCCGGGTYDEDGRVRKPCCSEMFLTQSGEGKNIQYILNRNIEGEYIYYGQGARSNIH